MSVQMLTGAARATPEPTRGRPRGFDEDAVLGKAMDFFWKRGARASMRELETALGLRQSSIYNAFGSKDALLHKALDRYEALADKALLQPLAANADALAALEDFFRNLRRWIVRRDRRGCMLINLMGEDGGGTPAIVNRSARYRERVRRALRDALQRAADAGDISSGFVEERAGLLMGLALGFNVAVCSGASRAEIDRLIAGIHGLCRDWRGSRRS